MPNPFNQGDFEDEARSRVIEPPSQPCPQLRNGQSARIWVQLCKHANEEFSLPELVAIAAGGGSYVTSISKRISECRRLAECFGWTLERTKDVMENGQRKTGYTLKTKI